MGLLLDIVVSLGFVFVIAGVIWLGANVLIAATAAICLPLYYLFRRSIRYVVVRGRSCRGHVGPSLLWAATYTLGNVAWLYAILTLARFLALRGQSLGM